MKHPVAIVLAVPFLAAASVKAQTIDVRTITCKEVAALPDATLRLLAVWLDGYLADDESPEDAKVDLAAAQEDAEDIQAHCEQNPAMGLLQAAEALEDD
ncbi:HdeA/HdeB family chaperone [Hyphomicrobium sp. CS1GBMeth3]|uniref:HdeA/HdeB family chaperone n=1 Tax=Hyphomicrobium sp. CS1GBMeth3 TaxID=1892845 RepID=UPI00093006FC|nr:HdeA/HdeB family chaperone [Hyphomicrobium sp. CS1GBMeth3]